MFSQTILHWVSQYGYAGIFFLLVLGIVGLPIPDETLLTFAGYLVYKGHLQPVPTLAASFLGSVCGISVSYALGRTLGLYLLHEYGPLVHLTPEKVEEVHQWFERVGRWGLTFGYFFPGIRHLTAYVAGASKLELPVFALFAYAGALLWSVTFITLGYFFGEQWAHVLEKVHGPLAIGSLLVAAFLLLYWLGQRRKRKRPL